MNRSLTAIIAEEKPNDRRKLEIYAAGLGINIVSSVGSGDWLIDDCVKYEPDLVFLNINLNGTDGLEAYKRVIDHGIYPYLVMVSGTKDPELILQGMKLNCVDFVSKPINIDHLSAAVEKVRGIIEKEMLISKVIPGNIIQIRSNYRTVFINENNLIYAQKVKGEHKIIIYVDGDRETVIRTTSSLKEIKDQCSDFIFSPNQSNLVNTNYISKIFASEDSPGTYIIKLYYDCVEIDLTRRRKKEFEQLFSDIGQRGRYSN